MLKALWCLFGLCLALSLKSVCAQVAPAYPLIPYPQQIEAQEGRYVIDERTRIALSDPSNPDMQRLAAFFVDLVSHATGVTLPVLTAPADSAMRHSVAFLLDGDAAHGPEGYRLSISPDGITVRAAEAAGLFYGMQTLRQLLPVSAEAGPPVRPTFRTTVPALEIRDAPRFAYRGMHLDVGRHFFPTAFIKRYIDLLALYKFNTFHWHLTEDQGWRIEIKQYPKLTSVGAYRAETMIGAFRDQPRQYDGQRYGGFYTQDEVREVVAYARDRHITIIPEIEMPGHSKAALSAYPELACTPGPFEAATLWGIFEDIYCPKEETFTFLENVLTEVMALFPSEYIHIGGDEAPKKRWKESEVAQEVIRREGLADEHALQSYFIRRIEAFLNRNGRKLIGWDEIIEGGLSPTATVMYWRSWATEGQPNPAKVAVQQGNPVIMTPNNTLYFDHYQAAPETEPLAIGGLTPLEEVYEYEPIPSDFTEAEARRVLGAQGNVWTEYMETPEKVEYMVFPRLLALSEVVWSPRTARDWDSFQLRLSRELSRLDALGVNYRVPQP